MTTEQRNVTVSQFISSGAWSHKDSPFARLNRGFNSINPSETVFSSSWLWQALQEPEGKKTRFTMGYPEEWQAFRLTEGSGKLLQKSALDLWVFRTLTAEERKDLRETLDENPFFRAVIAVNHLSDWKSLIEDSSLEIYFAFQRIYVSFLPPHHDMDPFLRPQEVLWQMKELPTHIPVLVQDFPKSETSFFHSLKKEDIAQRMQNENPALLRSLRALDRTGLGHLILFFEALLGFLVSYRVIRLFQAVGYVLQLGPWGHQLKKAATFIWYKLIFKPADQIWNLGVRRASIWSWHHVIWPVCSFVWYKILFRPLDYAWNMGIKKYSILLWYKALWPVISFFWYKIRIGLWVFLRYRLVEYALMALYPLRKIYWILSHEYDKRIRFRKRPHES